jgi:FlaG/FlaF family flagellin (archaellin)
MMTGKTCRFLRDRRAITPILSNILLMLVAVGVMAIATTATYFITTNLRENMSERLVIEDVWFNNSTGTVKVYLRNIGKIDVQISTVYINQVAQSFIKPFILKMNDHGWLDVSYNWASGNTYQLEVFTTRGAHVGGYYKAP